MDFNAIFRRALELNASDVFLTVGKIPAIRRCGKIERLDAPGIEAGDFSAFLSSLLTAEQRERYAETGAFDASGTVDETRYRFNFFNAQNAGALVARPLRNGDELEFEALGLPAAALRDFASERRGLVLVCGAAGSGKSTTLGAMINYINRNFRKHIVSVEDPVEYLHGDFQSLVAQREINSDATSFADALRSAVRESPDVIVIGEMRDLETMQIALSAALTGHLVISTVHTGDAVQSLERVINTFPADRRTAVAADLAAALIGVVAQRLIPCADGEGMVPAVELMGVTPMLRKLIAEQHFTAVEDAVKHLNSPHFQTFNRALLALLADNAIRYEDALEMCGNRDEFILLARGMESGVDAFREKLPEENADGEALNMRQLLYSAMRHHASDLILSAGCAPVLRLNGELAALEIPALSALDTQRLLFSMLSTRQRAEFESQREVDFAVAVTLPSGDGEQLETVRFRLNGFYQRGTVGVAVRVIPDRIPPPEELGLPRSLVDLASKRQGLILITGPTGHGKSTTLACLIELINQARACHIITIEDPIEYVHDNKLAVIEQREVHADTLGFAAALKFALRQDPDVILVGEMRDPETISAALTAAETGHLVLATLHTNNAPQTIDRIVDSFPSHQQNQVRMQLAGTILGVVAQRLVPRADGRGRAAAFEIMTGTTAIQALIRDGKTSQLQSVLETGYKDGMVTMDKALSELYSAGLIARNEYQALTKSFRSAKEY